MSKFKTKLIDGKLFLTSSDIQVGDNVYTCRTKDDYKNETFPIKALVVSEEDKFVWNVRAEGWSDDMSVLMPKNYCIKVIGEVSPDALSYVREGQEFDQSQVMGGYKSHFITIEDINKGYDFYRIKGPCGHMH